MGRETNQNTGKGKFYGKLFADDGSDDPTVRSEPVSRGLYADERYQRDNPGSGGKHRRAEDV